jgi:hypothetical protein
VRFPRGWVTALQLIDLDEIVDKTVERVIAQSKNSRHLLPAARASLRVDKSKRSFKAGGQGQL